MGIIPMGISFQYSLKGRRITMIRLMGLVELRPVGSLKRETVEQEEMELDEVNLEEVDNSPTPEDAAKLAAKDDWSAANKKLKSLSGTDTPPETRAAAKADALTRKQIYLDKQKASLNTKKASVAETNTSLRNIVGRIDEAPDNVVDSDTPPADSPDSGDESGMSKAQLMKLSTQSSEVYNMIGDGEDLEAWVQDKISKASDYMNSVHSHLQYQKNSANTIGNGEGAPADPSMPTDDTLSEGVKRVSKYKSIVMRK